LQDCLDVLVDMREDTRGSSETAKDARQQSKVMPLDLEVERQRTAVFDQELQAVGAHEEPHLENGHQLVSVPNGAAAPLGTGQTANGAGPVGNGLVEHHVIVDASGDERDSFIALASQGSLTSLMSSSTHLYADIPASPVLHQRLPDLQPHADIPTPRAQLQPLRGLEPISFREADFHDRKTDALADLSGELQSDGQICRELVGDIDDPGRSQHHQAAAVLFEIEVDKSRGGAIGLDVDHHVDHSIKIRQIKPGLISDWNFEHPDLKVAVGDYITEINGVSGDVRKLLVVVGQASKLKMTIQRVGKEKEPGSLVAPMLAPQSQSRELPVPEAPASAPNELGPGVEVRVVGLKARPEFNGLCGTIKRWDESTGRWDVRMEDGSGKMLKSVNLVIVSATAGEAADHNMAANLKIETAPAELTEAKSEPQEGGDEKRSNASSRSGVAEKATSVMTKCRRFWGGLAFR